MDQERDNPEQAGTESGAGGRFNRAKEFIGDKYAAASDSVKDRVSSVRERIGEVDVASMTEQVRGYVRANPGKALLISVGIGFVIGLLLRRDDDSDE